MAHRRKRRMGKISTGAVIGIAAGAGLLIYMMTKKTTPPPPTTVYVPVNTGSNTTGQIVEGATSVLNNIFGSLFP